MQLRKPLPFLQNRQNSAFLYTLVLLNLPEFLLQTFFVECSCGTFSENHYGKSPPAGVSGGYCHLKHYKVNIFKTLVPPCWPAQGKGGAIANYQLSLSKMYMVLIRKIASLEAQWSSG